MRKEALASNQWEELRWCVNCSSETNSTTDPHDVGDRILWDIIAGELTVLLFTLLLALSRSIRLDCPWAGRRESLQQDATAGPCSVPL